MKFKGLATLKPLDLMSNQVYFPVVINDLLKGLDPPPEYYTPFPSLEDVRNFKAKEFAFDIENDRYTQEISVVGFCAQPNYAICVPFRDPYLSEIKRIFREAKMVIGHNCIQHDLPILRKWDVPLGKECLVLDTMLLQHLVFPDFPHDLEFVGSQFCNKPAWKHEKGVPEIYNCRDTDVTRQVFNDLMPLLKKNNLLDLYHYVQVPLGKICKLMQMTGFKVDPNRIKEVRAKLLKESEELEQKLPTRLRTHFVETRRRVPAPPGTLGKSGKPVRYVFEPASERVVPWRSTEIKRGYLYSEAEGGLGIEPISDPKNGKITTGKLALNKIITRLRKQGRPEVAAVQALSKLNKIDELITTFAKEDMVKVERMHPHFNVHGTATGRLSSSDPNLQNIPESTRVMYVPSHAGWVIINVDYSNIENRLTAYLAGDTNRLRRYEDPSYSDYKQLASRAFGISYEEVEKDNDRESPYAKAKAIVLGTNYGLGEKKICNMYDMDPIEVRVLMATWRKEIYETTKWQERVTSEARINKVLTNTFGRKRWFYTSTYYTESLAFLPSSTAADVIYRAMIGLMYERIDWPLEKALRVSPICAALPKPAQLLIQVHDSLVFECPENLVDEAVNVIKRVMEQPWKELKGFHIPVSVEIGPSWGECENYQTKWEQEASHLTGAINDD